MLLTVLWVTTAIVAVLLYFKQKFARFSNHGVKHLKPVPVLGTMSSVLFRREHITEYMVRAYNEFSSERFYGVFEFSKPIVVVRDLELVKKIAIKDFEHFVDHRSFVSGGVDDLFERNILALKGQDWKDMRSTLSPAFTSSKLRLMLPFMMEVGKQMTEYLKQMLQECKNDYVDIEFKDIATRYANDVIASCAFGLKVDSLTEQNNQFYRTGKEITNMGFKVMLKMLLFLNVPKIAKKFNITLLSASTTRFFSSLILNTMKDREAHNIVRPDMIQLLMEARKGQLVHEENLAIDTDAGFASVQESSIGAKKVNKEWSDMDIVAQAVIFLIGGFDTVSTAMTFALYELGVNPDVQEKLAKEIKEVDEKNGGKFDYNSIHSMAYMDMVVSEVLRLWSPGGLMDRLCTKDYNLGKPNDTATKDFIIRKGEGIQVHTWAFHRDPDFFPNPAKFDPERFSEENKHNIKPFTYVPFGLGPRNCIGSRFALYEVKVFLYQVLLNFELCPCEKTCIPAELSKETFNFSMKGGHWLRLKARE